MDLTREAIDRIAELAAPTLEDVAGRPYSSKALVPVQDPMPVPVHLNSLQALADFLKWEFPGGRTQLVAQVVNETFVLIHGRLIFPWQQRPVLAKTEFEEGTKFPFGQYLDQERFLIGVQVGFVPDEATARLLKLVGTVEDSKVLKLQDDGVSQQVSASVGLARVELMTVPNPVELCPYRTFAEVLQPSSKYIVRARSGQAQEPPTFALHLVEDPRWRAQARAYIADYLKTQVSDLTVLA